jgi:hypothetical protein
VAGDDVVEGEVVSGPAAIDARPTVPGEDLLACEADAWARSLDHVKEANDGGEDEGVRSRVEDAGSRLEDLGFPTQHQHERAADIADVERLVILVQHEDGYGALHRRSPALQEA